MDNFLSRDILSGLSKARAKPKDRKHRLRLRVGNEVFPLIDAWKGGFSVARADCPNLRGFVELFDGSRHLASCLVICAHQDDEVMRYEYKRVTRAALETPKDFAIDASAPAGLIMGPAN